MSTIDRAISEKKSVKSYLKNSLLGLLSPFSFLWETLYKLRRFSYNFGLIKKRKFNVPIISIGNITFGGTGKTPFSIWLAEYLATLDKKVMILMRGYKGNLEQKSGILRAGKKLGFSPFDFGDEALLLARRLKKASVVVGKKRSDNLEYYFPSEQSDVVLLDDGHQHLKLDRDLNIVLFDSLMDLSRYKLAPRGYLREGFSSLRDADLIVLGRADQVSNDQLESLKGLIKPHLKRGVPFSEIGYKPTGLFDINFTKAEGVEYLKGKRVVCVAGVASPESFFSLVEYLGADVVEHYSYPDHYFFKKRDILDLVKKAKESNAFILTTEKDMVKIRKVTEFQSLMYLGIEVSFRSGEEELKERVSSVL